MGLRFRLLNKLSVLGVLFAVFFTCGAFAQSDDLIYPVDDSTQSPLYLTPPQNIKTSVEYDPETNEYILLKKIGDIVIERKILSFAEYQNYDMDKITSERARWYKEICKRK